MTLRMEIIEDTITDNSLQKKNLRDNRMSKKKKFDEYKVSEPVQMSLFKFIEVAENRDFSQTIELYDFMPKYIWDKRSVAKDGNVILREFECRGVKHLLGIHPASLVDHETGETRYEYPGKSEQLVEEVLRKLAIEGTGKFLDQNAAVTFSLYEVRQELEKHNHTMNYRQIRESLEILAFTRIELIDSKNKRDKIIFSPIENLGISGDGEETQTFAVFSPLVTKSILNTTFRLYNYRQVMNYRSAISRLLHKRLAHHFTQASITTKYTILVSTIIRDFGLTPQARVRVNMEHIKSSLEEMMTGVYVKNKKKDTGKLPHKNFRPVILNYEILPDYEGKKVIDYRIEITPSPFFVSETIKANKIEKSNLHLGSEKTKD